MAADLPDSIWLIDLILGDELLGGTLGDDRAVFKAYPTFRLDKPGTLPRYPRRNYQWYLYLNRLFYSDADAGGEAGVSRGISYVAHSFIEQRAQYAPVQKTRPALVRFIRSELCMDTITIPREFQFKPDGVVPPAPEAEAFIEIGVECYFRQGYHDFISVPI
jgi:hypothetical protein